MRDQGVRCSDDFAVAVSLESCRRDSGARVMRVHEIAHTRVHYGYRRVHVMLRREGNRRQSQAGLSLVSGARLVAKI